MKKAWKVISTALVWLMVAVSVSMMIFTIVSVNTFNRNDRNLFGLRFYIVLSDSMSATDFDAGDLVVVKANTSFRRPYSTISSLIYVGDTYGAGAANLKQLHWHALPAGMYPFDLPDGYTPAPAKLI